MRKILKVVGKILKSVGSGVVDTVLPNIKDSIKMSDSDLPDDKKKFDVDFPRLIASITVWIILLLVFFGKVKFSDVVEIITKLLILK
jgi:hypothetical protein